MLPSEKTLITFKTLHSNVGSFKYLQFILSKKTLVTDTYLNTSYKFCTDVASLRGGIFLDLTYLKLLVVRIEPETFVK